MADIFLSYASVDRKRIRALVKVFEEQGWSVWWDRKIPPGKTWHQVIQQAIDEAKCVVVVWSQHSIQSDWVITEAEEGKDRRALIPVLIDNVKAPLAFRRIQSARLIDWQGESSHHELESLFDAISAILGKPESAKETTRQSGQIFEVPPPPKLAKGKSAQKPQVNKAAAPSFEFDVVTVDAQGNVTKRRKERARYFIEDLGKGVKLEMVEIPGGVFTMGSPDTEAERSWNEGPQHRVTVQPFAMGKFQVTQSQWRAMAKLPKVKIDLEPDPSRFKGEDLPVETVSWDDAIEFCARLSRKTGKIYRLPCEAEWEYACRAGTTTPFHFGGTITPDLVNYSGYHPYGNAPKGESRWKTTPVGSFRVANVFGLFDMHGNVWEWCEDNWHKSYDGAPNDGRVWVGISATASYHVIRGGGWYSNAFLCRSAHRGNDVPGNRCDYLGFRLVRV